jgi:hypothetical protein
VSTGEKETAAVGSGEPAQPVAEQVESRRDPNRWAS